MKNKILERTKEKRTRKCETRKEENTSSGYILEYEKNKETVNACDNETGNERDDCFSIYE